MKHSLLASRVQLEHRAAARRVAAIEIATINRGAVEVPLWVTNQTRERAGPGRAASKTVQHGLLAGCIELEHCSAAGPGAALETPHQGMSCRRGCPLYRGSNLRSDRPIRAAFK